MHCRWSDRAGADGDRIELTEHLADSYIDGSVIVAQHANHSFAEVRSYNDSFVRQFSFAND